MEPLNTQIETPKQNNNSLIYILLFIIIVLLGYIGYIYSTKDIVKKQYIQDNYIKKEDITFDTLPVYIQDKYVLKSLYDYKVNQLENKINTISKSMTQQETSKQQILEKTIEVEKIVEVESTKDDSAVLEKQQISKTYTCKTLKSSSEYITKECKNALIAFLDKNKDAKRFEVIGLIDNQEFVLIEKLEDVYGKKRLGNLSKYAQTGLSKQRVIEASWVIRQHLGKDRQIDGSNYTITKQNKRGFVVKAYK